MVDVNETLKERGERYGGSYEQDDKCALVIMEIFANTPNWFKLSSSHKHALIMTAVKLSRILNGDPNHKDSWHDIAGYATLAERSIDG
jgi:exopolyphosphatase/pppGpp-phosphohydrolase